MNFAQLIASVIEDLFPSGQPENLVGPHLKFFVQAMCDIQNAVSCYRYGNTDFFPQCATYFNCGLTVLPQPAGQVLRVYTIGKQQAGANTPVADLTVTAPLSAIDTNGNVISPVTSGKLATIATDGLYTISVTSTNAFKALYPANSPQYFRMDISYTDATGNVQTVQPAALIHVSDSIQTGSLVVDSKGGTDVIYTITPYNIPQTDGEISVEMSVVSGVTGATNDDWCSKVYYHQVEYMHIERYVRECRNCSTNTIWGVANAIAANLFGHWRCKRVYNAPTDIGFESLPPLPPGFHYPQTSTDAGGRSRGGVYAIKGGNIYIAPWIESTESVVVEWNGLKTNWAATDLVTDDPKFIEAVRLNVGIQHYMSYEDNDKRLKDFRVKYSGGHDEGGTMIIGVLRELIHACRERIRVRTNQEVGTNEGDAAIGVNISTGVSSSTGIYYNAAQSSGGITTPAGAYSSTLSQADADAQAIAAAQAAAQSQSSGTSGNVGIKVYLNTQQTYTAQCPAASGTTPAATGNSATVTVLAGQYQSVISQALADAAALSAAKSQAQSQLVCTYFNAPQTANIKCADNTSETATIPAGQFASTESQDDANQQALAAAQTQATRFCANPPGAFTIGNTTQTVPFAGIAVTTCGNFPIAGQVIIPANTFMGQTNAANQSVVQANLNQQALNYANLKIIAAKQAQTLAHQLSCGHAPFRIP